MSLSKDTTLFQSFQISSSPSKSSPPPKPLLSTIPNHCSPPPPLSLSLIATPNTENYREWQRRTHLWYVSNLQTLISPFFTSSFQLLLRFYVFFNFLFAFQSNISSVSAPRSAAPVKATSAVCSFASVTPPKYAFSSLSSSNSFAVPVALAPSPLTRSRSGSVPLRVRAVAEVCSFWIMYL